MLLDPRLPRPAPPTSGTPAATSWPPTLRRTPSTTASSTPTGLPLNLHRFLFLDDRAPSFFLDWDGVADDSVAALRPEAGRHPDDRSLTDLVGELATKSQAFRRRWAQHNVKHHRTAAKRLHNDLVGDIDLTGESLELPGENLVIITYTAEPDSPAAEALRFLTSWATHPGAPVERPSPH